MVKINKKGIVLIEVVFACTIISIITIGVMVVASKSISLSNFALKQVQASFLLEEGAEAVKSIRDTDWNNISSLVIDETYYLSFNTGTNKWSLSTTPGLIDGFSRTIIVSEVERDSNDDIADSGTTDTNTKKITVTISWFHSGGIVSKTLVFYLAKIF